MQSISKKYANLASKKDLIILGIESSCDETSASVVKNGRTILSNEIASQIEIHQRFGGVVPEVASRNHTLCINSVVDKALKNADVGFNDIDAVAVTYGAGLAGALLVGVSYAKALAYSLDLPLVRVNHIEAHIVSNYIEHGIMPPFLAVVASGGHTSLVHVLDYNTYCLVGGTQDDAIGEAFDKVARLLNLGYPGGPIIDKLSKNGQSVIEFYKNTKTVNKELKLSYSGLKTAVVNYLHNARQKGEQINVENVCASFTKCAVNLLVDTAIFAAKKLELNTVCLAGGVAANSYLRQNLHSEGLKAGLKVLYPQMVLCTDNAAMVAARAYHSIICGKNLADLSLNAQSNLRMVDAKRFP